MILKGSQIILECLKEQGVEVIFGYPGGQIMPLYDALYDYIKSGELRHILTSHEQGATHAADGYARSTGNVGVCFATSGPGATNTVTGIATAYLDSIPMVVITGQVPSALIGRDAFQEIDIAGITIPITKHNYFIRSVEDIADCIREAFCIARSGRPGPVLIDIPKNFFVEKTEFKPKKDLVLKSPNPKINLNCIQKAADMINQSKKPVIYAGGGVRGSESHKELVELAEKSQIPVLSTLMGLGCIPRDNPLSMGMVGMHGYKNSNMAMHHSDLIIAIGARFSDRVTGDTSRFAKEAQVIHIDIDDSEIGKNVKHHHQVRGDVKDILSQLIPLVESNERRSWLTEVQSWRPRPAVHKKELNPDSIFETLAKVADDQTFFATDVGQHQMWTAQKWRFNEPRTLITSGGLGTMGFGLGAAIGVKIGNPDRKVLHITGDGSFRMNFNELATVAGEELDIITIVIKNNTLGMVRQWQKLFFDKRYSATDLKDVIDYEKLGGAFGISTYMTNNVESLETAFRQAYQSNKAAIIVCDISIDENVFPIVPPGEAINNQVYSEA